MATVKAISGIGRLGRLDAKVAAGRPSNNRKQLILQAQSCFLQIAKQKPICAPFHPPTCCVHDMTGYFKMNVNLKSVLKYMPKEVAVMRKENNRQYYKMTRDTMHRNLVELKDSAVYEGIRKEFTRKRYNLLVERVHDAENLKAHIGNTYLKNCDPALFPYIQAIYKFHLVLAEKFIFKDDDFAEIRAEEHKHEEIIGEIAQLFINSRNNTHHM